jgi:hypothetical protein
MPESVAAGSRSRHCDRLVAGKGSLEVLLDFAVVSHRRSIAVNEPQPPKI